jgi:hypothetical protein
MIRELFRGSLASIAALCVFVYFQLRIHKLFLMWKEEHFQGIFSRRVTWQLLLANIAFIIISLIACLAVLTFDVAITHRLYNPFGHDFVLYQAALFYADQAMKGLLVDVAHVFDFSIPTTLYVNSRQHWGFGLLLVVFRLTVPALTATLAISLISRALLRKLLPIPLEQMSPAELDEFQRRIHREIETRRG